MNNKRILIVGVLAAIVTMMVGYALFSETITINGTATAKGDFSITPSCQTTVPSVLAQDFNNFKDEGGYENETCQVSGTTVTTSVGLKYPGAQKYLYTEHKNTGSMDAYVKFDSDSVEDTFPTYDGLSLIYKLYDKKTDTLLKTIDAITGEGMDDSINADDYGIMMPAKYFIKTEDGSYLNISEDRKDTVLTNRVYSDSEGNFYFEVKPNESFVVVLLGVWSYCAEQTDYYSIMEMKLNIPFVQKSDNMQLKTEGTYPDLCGSPC